MRSLELVVKEMREAVEVMTEYDFKAKNFHAQIAKCRDVWKDFESGENKNMVAFAILQEQFEAIVFDLECLTKKWNEEEKRFKELKHECQSLLDGKWNG
jgi:chromosome segregation ATPase